MSVIQGILLGILQGVAEFLPISSSGHLQVAQTLFNLEEVPLLYDVFLHLATLAAVVLYFWKKIWILLKAFGRWITRKPASDEIVSDDVLTCNDKACRKTIIAIIISSAVTGAIGVVTSKFIPDMPINVVCGGFITTASILICSSWIQKRRQEKTANSPVKPETAEINSDQSQMSETSAKNAEKSSVSWVQALVIGFMQGFGTLPGISRSGSTIAGAIFAGVDRKAAGEYSFIVSIPAILGAFILELKDLGEVNSTVGIAPVIAGCISAFVVGYFSLACLMKIIRKGKLEWFAAYLIPLGVLGILFL